MFKNTFKKAKTTLHRTCEIRGVQEFINAQPIIDVLQAYIFMIAITLNFKMISKGRAFSVITYPHSLCFQLNVLVNVFLKKLRIKLLYSNSLYKTCGDITEKTLKHNGGGYWQSGPGSGLRILGINSQHSRSRYTVLIILIKFLI